MLRNSLITILLLLTGLRSFSQDKLADNRIASATLKTSWGTKVTASNCWREYPRPTLQRGNWSNLNGYWAYSITDSAAVNMGATQGQILVPFPIESQLSGVQRSLGPKEALWYKTQFEVNKLKSGDRCLLNFGAVDWKAAVFVNGKPVGAHVGGYENFTLDITEALKIGQKNVLEVKVTDPTDRGINPHGKQVLYPGNIFYTPSSGIWQTVWLENVPQQRIEGLKITPDIEKQQVAVTVNGINTTGNDIVELVVKKDGKEVTRLSGPSNAPLIAKIKNAALWTPESPNLYDVVVMLKSKAGVTDEVSSYFGMRKISVGQDAAGHKRIFLNNKYLFNLGVLDQGFWPDGLMTPPSDEAIQFDLQAMKAMGFNTVRKHIKVEPERWYYHADKIGLLVWQDFVNPPNALPEGSKPEFEREVKATMDQLYNHPSVVTWVLFNERWGAYDQKRLTSWVKQYDPTRLVNGHSGELLYVNDKLRAPSKEPWIESDIADIHAYPYPRKIDDDFGKIQVLGEFGGITVSTPWHQWNDLDTWGYTTQSPEDFIRVYRGMLDSLKSLEKMGLSAAIYTQPFDVETEENGVITYDRAVIKMPFDTMSKINSLLVHANAKDRKSPLLASLENIDIHDNDSRYQEYLTQFRNGNHDSAFVRRLILMAMRKNDKQPINDLSAAYLKSLKSPDSYANLMFILNFTNSSDNPGFALLTRDGAIAKEVVGKFKYNGIMRKLISAEIINPAIKSSSPVDWEAIHQTVLQKYGEDGGEYVWGKAMTYSIDHKSWSKMGEYYKKYYQTALPHSEYHINNMSWIVFENVDDTSILRFALSAVKYNMENFSDGGADLDTYANLYYRLGEKEEALKWERKALEKSPQDEDIKAALRKMEQGLPTWPTPNGGKN